MHRYTCTFTHTHIQGVGVGKVSLTSFRAEIAA